MTNETPPTEVERLRELFLRVNSNGAVLDYFAEDLSSFESAVRAEARAEMKAMRKKHLRYESVLYKVGIMLKKGQSEEAEAAIKASGIYGVIRLCGAVDESEATQ